MHAMKSIRPSSSLFISVGIVILVLISAFLMFAGGSRSTSLYLGILFIAASFLLQRQNV